VSARPDVYAAAWRLGALVAERDGRAWLRVQVAPYEAAEEDLDDCLYIVAEDVAVEGLIVLGASWEDAADREIALVEVAP
jgi:hypothetical protein